MKYPRQLTCKGKSLSQCNLGSLALVTPLIVFVVSILHCCEIKKWLQTPVMFQSWGLHSDGLITCNHFPKIPPPNIIIGLNFYFLVLLMLNFAESNLGIWEANIQTLIWRLLMLKTILILCFQSSLMDPLLLFVNPASSFCSLDQCRFQMREMDRILRLRLSYTWHSRRLWGFQHNRVKWQSLLAVGVLPGWVWCGRWIQEKHCWIQMFHGWQPSVGKYWSKQWRWGSEEMMTLKTGLVSDLTQIILTSEAQSPWWNRNWEEVGYLSGFF